MAVERRAGGAQYIPRPAVWSLDEFAVAGTYPLNVSVDDVVAALAGSPPGGPLLPAFPRARPSAVFVVLADGTDGAEVLLTRRSMDLSNHRGEISFPGGRMDPDESPVDAARREAFEEVGLDPAATVVIGELEHLNTVVSRSYIVPVVARLVTAVTLTPAAPEVERILWVPLAEFVRPDTYRVERWGRQPTDRRLHFFELDDETVWGATAAILIDLLARLSPVL